MKINKIIYLVASTFSQRDYKRFGIEVFIQDGFGVYVWDFTPFLYGEKQRSTVSPDPGEFKNLIKFYRKSDAISAIDKEGPRTFIISLIPHDLDTIKIFRAISKNKILYSIRADASPFSGNNKTIGNFINKVVSVTPKKIINYLKQFYMNIYTTLHNYSPATLVLLGGSRSSLDRDRVNFQTQNLWIHALDYDIYLNDQKIGTVETKNAIFIDNYFPFHPDPIRVGKSAHVNPDKYYPLLCNFFDYVEENLGLNVVIAAHPRSRYEEQSDFFQGRKVVRGKTPELVRDAKLVILHCSASITFAVLYKKPMIFITTDGLLRTKFRWVIPRFASYFGKIPINISRDLNIDLMGELEIDEDRYAKFKHDFIKKEGSEELPFWQVVSNKIKSLDV